MDTNLLSKFAEKVESFADSTIGGGDARGSDEGGTGDSTEGGATVHVQSGAGALRDPTC